MGIRFILMVNSKARPVSLSTTSTSPWKNDALSKARSFASALPVMSSSWRCEFVIGSTEQFQFKFLSINWCDKHNPSPSVWEVQVILSGECSFVEHRTYKLCTGATHHSFSWLELTMVKPSICATVGYLNELAILEFIHLLVETMDRHFGNVCELDIMFIWRKRISCWRKWS
ncbi:AP-4 complex subunit sigma [Vitis vinifera]|uniref:AP-4 complex subunit sigma n=1 Tax=Vitis vinifera TaxID=29760 RepID=A0A438DS33_VITVI|nr:AP-4 complex subunit sigma [Vitis vinifera]